MHVNSTIALSSYECQKLATFLNDVAEWLDDCEVATEFPDHPVVYAITDGHSHHKIGKAVNFERRLKQLQTGNGRRLRIVAYLRVDDDHRAYVAESAAKRSLDQFKAVGEWFECGSHTVFQALHEAAHAAGIAYRPVSICVGHEDGEQTEANTDGR